MNMSSLPTGCFTVSRFLLITNQLSF